MSTYAEGMNLLKLPSRHPYAIHRASSCAKRGGHARLFRFPKAHADTHPRPPVRGRRFYTVLNHWEVLPPAACVVLHCKYPPLLASYPAATFTNPDFRDNYWRGIFLFGFAPCLATQPPPAIGKRPWHCSVCNLLSKIRRAIETSKQPNGTSRRVHKALASILWGVDTLQLLANSQGRLGCDISLGRISSSTKDGQDSTLRRQLKRRTSATSACSATPSTICAVSPSSSLHMLLNR